MTPSAPSTSPFLTTASELDYGTSIHQSPDVLSRPMAPNTTLVAEQIVMAREILATARAMRSLADKALADANGAMNSDDVPAAHAALVEILNDLRAFGASIKEPRT